MIALAIGAVLLLGGCTSFDDWSKDWESDTKGLERTITIYSKTGEVLKQYEGENVRTKYSDGGTQVVLNIDGKRVQVVNADVVITEKGAEKYETK